MKICTGNEDKYYRIFVQKIYGTPWSFGAMSMWKAQQFPQADLIKGKEAVSYLEKVLSRRNKANERKKARLRWAPINQGRVKLNEDGSFVPATGAAGTDMVLRNTSGGIIFTACDEGLQLPLT